MKKIINSRYQSRLKKIVCCMLAFIFLIMQIPFGNMKKVTATEQTKTVQVTVMTEQQIQNTSMNVAIHAQNGDVLGNAADIALTLDESNRVAGTFIYNGTYSFVTQSGENVPAYVTYHLDGKDYYAACTAATLDEGLTLATGTFLPIRITEVGGNGTIQADGAQLPQNAVVYCKAGSQLSIKAADSNYISKLKTQDAEQENYSQSVAITLPEQADSVLNYTVTYAPVTVGTNESDVVLTYATSENGTYQPVTGALPQGEIWIKMTTPDKKRFQERDGVTVAEHSDMQILGEEFSNDYKTYTAKVKIGAYNQFQVSLINEYTVTIVVDANGTVKENEESITGTVSYEQGESPVFTMEPKTGYALASVKDNGLDVMDKLTDTGRKNDSDATISSYEIPHIQNDSKLEVTFVEDTRTIQVSEVNGQGSLTFSDQVEADPNDASMAKVQYGKGKTEAFTVGMAGSDVESVSLNGSALSEDSSTDNYYKVNEDNSITVTLNANNLTRNLNVEVQYVAQQTSNDGVKINFDDDAVKTPNSATITHPVTVNDTLGKTVFVYKSGTDIAIKANNGLLCRNINGINSLFLAGKLNSLAGKELSLLVKHSAGQYVPLSGSDDLSKTVLEVVYDTDQPEVAVNQIDKVSGELYNQDDISYIAPDSSLKFDISAQDTGAGNTEQIYQSGVKKIVVLKHDDTLSEQERKDKVLENAGIAWDDTKSSYQYETGAISENTVFDIYAVDKTDNISLAKQVKVVADTDNPEIENGKTSLTFSQEHSESDDIFSYPALRLNFLPSGSYFANAAQSKVQIAVKAKDAGAGVAQISLCDAAGNTVGNSTGTIEKVDGSYQATLELSEDFTSYQGNLNIVLVDHVNHKAVIPVTAQNSNLTSDKVVIEQDAPTCTMSVENPEGVTQFQDNDIEVYNGDVTFHYSITDKKNDTDPYSGIFAAKVFVNDECVEQYDFTDETVNTKVISGDISTKGKTTTDGAVTIKIVAVDNAGNVTEPVIKTIYIDNQNPVIKDDKGSITFSQNNENNGFTDVVLNILTFGTYFSNKEDNRTKVNVVAYDDAQDSTSYESGVVSMALYSAENGGEQIGSVKGKIKHSQTETGESCYTAEMGIDRDEYTGPIYIELTDRAGHVNRTQVNTLNSNIDNTNFMLEKDAPQTDINLSKADTTSTYQDIYNGDVKANITVTDPDSGINKVVINVNGFDFPYSYQDAYTTEGHYTIDTADSAIQPDENGSYTITVKSIDNAGNANIDNQISFSIDKTAPVITSFEFSNADGSALADGDSIGDKIEAGISSYEYYFRQAMTVTVTADDRKADGQAASGLQSITAYVKDYESGQYYAAQADGTLAPVSEDQLQSIVPITTQDNAVSFVVPENFKGQLFAFATDQVNNAGSAVSPDGSVVESPEKHEQENHIVMEKDSSDMQDIDGNELFADNVNMYIEAIDTYSGLEKVEWEVSAPYDTDNNQSGVITIDNDGTLQGDTQGWGIPDEENATERNLVKKLSSTLAITNNSNDITVTVRMTDRTGNTSEQEMHFSIDKTAPEITLDFDNQASDPEYTDYYNAARTATITVRERNFTSDDVTYEISNNQNGIPALSDWSTIGSDDPDQTLHIAQVVFSEDGEYEFHMSVMDNANNGPAEIDTQKFTIDQTRPVISVTYDNDNYANGNYYKDARTATIAITEHNFDASRVSVSGTGDGFPSLGGWSQDGDVHSATLYYGSDGEYTFAMGFTDMAGNTADDVAEQDFIIDQTDPELTITGVEDQAAYNGTITPDISCSDTNMDASGFQVTLEKDGEEVSYDKAVLQDGMEFAYSDFADTKDADGIYTLKASATDRADRTVEKTVTFSVNRYGSNYLIADDVKNILGKYVKDNIDVVISEVNVDDLAMNTIKVVLTKNGTPETLTEGKDYTLDKTGGNGRWCEYTYTIGKQKFESDGTYIVTLYSVDKAGNINQSADENKAAEVSFGIDHTDPEVVAMDIEDGGIYPVDSKEVTASVTDNLVLDHVSILVNGEEVNYDKDGDNYTFLVNNSTEMQSVRVIATDAADNTKVYDVNNVLVTSNLWIRFIHNRMAVILVITGVVCLCAIVAGSVVVIRSKKKKKEEM